MLRTIISLKKFVINFSTASNVANNSVFFLHYQISNQTLDSLHTRCVSTEKLDLSWSGPYDAVTAHGMCRYCSEFEVQRETISQESRQVLQEIPNIVI